MARVGGVVFPKQLQQFDAVAYYNGPDGKSDTDDDLEIGRVNATWSLEEYGVTYDDDDIKFVGSDRPERVVHARTPTGPIRRAARAATTSATCGWSLHIKPPGKTPQTLKARALLIVTVPLYVKFRPWQSQP